jgi:predicted nucleic acid-binding protein
VSVESPPEAMLDTSAFIAAEQGRPLGAHPRSAAISVVTLAELRIGVAMAPDPAAQAQRLATFARAQRLFEPLPITVEVADVFADMVADARLNGRRPQVMDVWIAATAVVHGLPVYTQDAGFDGLRGVTVVRI